MIGILLVIGALLVTMLVSELALNGTKLQTGLGRVLLVWAAIYLGALYPLARFGGVGLFPYTIFWGGAFLSWFGVRSHIESSILLRMLYLLRRGPLSQSDLLAAYTAQYGANLRLEELFRGGMAVERHGRIDVTAKGKSILRVVALLRD